jgi:decaprenylphospho-beta-D-erythro-pentofuranosid-2-ulose 2-reductase
VLLVRPGFVTGRMTAGMDAAPMATTPEAVARATATALAAGREVVWVPGTLRWVFAAFRHLPRPLWRRLPV